MTLTEARKLRDKLRAHKLRATVPLGVSDYFVRVKINGEQHEFYSLEEWNAFVRAEQRKIVEWAERHGFLTTRDTRSPIERMIDQATGRTP